MYAREAFSHLKPSAEDGERKAGIGLGTQPQAELAVDVGPGLVEAETRRHSVIGKIKL